MNIRGIVVGSAVLAGAAAAVVMVLNRRHAQWDRQMRESAKTIDRSPYTEVIAERLHDHEGEEAPFVVAFEEALEREARFERQLARETGLES